MVCEAIEYVSDFISCRKCKLPFVSSVDHVEGDYKFKPGTYMYEYDVFNMMSLCRQALRHKMRLTYFCYLRSRDSQLLQ